MRNALVSFVAKCIYYYINHVWLDVSYMQVGIYKITCKGVILQ